MIASIQMHEQEIAALDLALAILTTTNGDAFLETTHYIIALHDSGSITVKRKPTTPGQSASILMGVSDGNGRNNKSSGETARTTNKK